MGTNTTTAAPRPFAQLAAVEPDLRVGTVVRVAPRGPELRIENMERVNSELGNLTVVLTILTGSFAGSVVTRHWHSLADEIQIVRGAIPAGPTVTFVPIIPADYGDPLPACPDGSGDLWWDDASYIRYQSYDPHYVPEHIAEISTTPGYCDGRPMIYALDRAIGHSCPCHTPEQPSMDDCPF